MRYVLICKKDGRFTLSEETVEDARLRLTLSLSIQVEKPSSMAFSAVRNWWNTYQLDKSDTNHSNPVQDAEELARRRQLSINLSHTLRTRQLLIDFDGGRPILSLRAPLDLVNFPSVSRPRWPTECEVVSDIIHHIEWDPPEPEPFYQPTGLERTPMPAREDRGKVVYCIDHATKHPFFTCSRVGGSRGPIKSATFYDISESDLILEFESRFESGNLQKVVQVGVYDYELTLRTDMYTNKHTQWFYFRVRNTKAGVTYRFTIVNLMKSSSLYCHGMRPLLYSERAAKEKGVGWQRTGYNIRYYRSCNQNTDNDTTTLYSLTWTLQFPYDSDTCYLAHCYPYTYSHLQHYLRRISSNPTVASYCKVRVLCRSLAGNAVYVLTITSRGATKFEGRAKKTVVVTARVHPGETNGSWMMEGFLDFLLGDSEDAKLLRDMFVFKVVPMLNPDGVVVGNYRCSLAGRDLNRNYKTLLRESFPCAWYTRNMVERLMTETDVVLYCDFHGHSRKNNVFMYGCNSRGDAALKLHERVFPLMMSKNASNKFSFKSCKFRVQKSKEGTGRIAMWNLGIKNSYTMEATFGGSTLGDRRGTHFTTRDLKSLGFYFCDTLLDYYDPDPSKISYCLTELAVLLRKEIRERLGKDLGFDSKISVSDLETSTSGSNSSDSDGLPVHLLNQPQTVLSETPVKKKKKRQKSRKERNRLRPERVINTQPKVQESSKQNIEVNLLHDNTVKEKHVGRDRKRYQVNGLIRKAGIPPATGLPGEVSQVTLWQGCEPVKGDYLEDMRAPCPYHRTRPCPDFSSYIATFPQTEDQRMDMRPWRCSCQSLHLSTLLPPQTNCIQQQHPFPQQPFVAYKVYRDDSSLLQTVSKIHLTLSGLPASMAVPHRNPSCMFFKRFSHNVPATHLLSNLTADKFNNRHISDRSYLRTSQRYFAPEDSSTNDRQDNHSKQGMSLLSCVPFEEQSQRELTPTLIPLGEEAHTTLFVPVLKGTDAKGQRNKRHNLPLVRKSPGIRRVELPRPQSDTFHKLQTPTEADNIRHYSSGKERQIPMTPKVATVSRLSQSGPL